MPVLDITALQDRLDALEAAVADLNRRLSDLGDVVERLDADHTHDGYASTWDVEALERTIDRLGQRIDRSLTNLGRDIDDARDIANRADRRR